ncbi:MAG: transposase, partial [Fibromonadaceae bacterium]|nr:transposase [Fibromonadaceae bacterium]
VGKTSIERWLSSYRATGTAGGGYSASIRPPKKIEPDKLAAYMKERPDAFLKEIAQEFSCCIEAARKALKRNGFTLKKRRSATRSAMRRQGLPA